MGGAGGEGEKDGRTRGEGGGGSGVEKRWRGGESKRRDDFEKTK